MRDLAHERDEISRSILRIHAGVSAFAGAMIGGAVLFIMTIWLVLKGGPHVGLHLQLLSNYFPGYSVTWVGSIVGLLYGAVTGGLLGWTVATLYNMVVKIRSG